MDQRTRNLMAMHKVLHPRDDIDRLYVPGTKGGRGLTSIEDSSIQRLDDYIEKRRNEPITATRNNSGNTKTNSTTITRKQNGSKTTLWAF